MELPEYFPDINLNDYFYELPKERIALYPAENREESKLLFANEGTGEISHHHFSDLPSLIDSDTLIVFNKTKVISARLYFRKPTGGKVEILLIEPLTPSTDPQIVMSGKLHCVWKCIIGGKRVLNNDIFMIHKSGFALQAKILHKSGNEAEVLFSWNNDVSFAEIVAAFGIIPLPPYIKRETEEIDKDRYQTVYADANGSVAAPTAGLHFTGPLIETMKTKGITFADIILHVGPGTFLPVGNDNIAEHKMHEEQFFVSRTALSVLLDFISSGKRIIATGTTTLRTIESLYWLGVKLLSCKFNLEEGFFLDQFEPYLFESTLKLPDITESISALIKYLDDKKIENIHCRTKLLIVPGYNFKIINGMITNYHIPKSTLILLVAAFIGKDLWRKVYDEALTNDYRFLSYGDSSLLLRSP